MENHIKQILLEHDTFHDGTYEFPPNHSYDDYLKLREQVQVMEQFLEELLNNVVVDHFDAQDATYGFCSTAFEAPFIKGQTIGSPIVALIFSNFGKMVTVWTPEPLRLEQSKAIVTRLERLGLVYIPRDALDEAYDGVHALFKGQSWLYRFFSEI